MKISSLVCVLSLGLAAVACGGSEPAAQDPSTTNANVAAAPPVEAPAPAAPVEPAKPAKLEPLGKPASTWMAGGKSLSEVSGEDLAATLKKAGWIKGTDAKIVAATTGQYESMTIPLEKGKVKGTFKLIRPAAMPGAPETAAQAVMPSKAADTLSKDTGSSYYDEASDVFVSIELTEGGKAADAKKALDGVAKPGKAAVGTTAPAAAGDKPADKKPAKP